ncbi:hypothetical protein [Motilimonas eburnea]|uniref:hypothetical protein n=1 Tax=Motilimonas eburnea TaxID=1737488 RepID=UPI001E2FB3B0|nr:hypothetical protein [Motilimonas eburnea]MCE2573171.1 hypothetical protein [Motilimonas eburnea]
MEVVKQQTCSCQQCGAQLKFDLKDQVLTCPYCQHQQTIEQSDQGVYERDLVFALEQQSQVAASEPIHGFNCEQCGGYNQIQSYQSAGLCLYCNAPYVLDQVQSEQHLMPQALLPFSISQESAQREIKKWLHSLWFAPTGLKRIAKVSDKLKGIYYPFWTFDANSSTYYEGQRGTHYYTNETYTTTENGKSVTRTRRVQHTRWVNVSGRIENSFDDVLVAANTALPETKLDALSPWLLDRLIPYDKDYLRGYVAQSYNVPLRRGFDNAKQAMAGEIRRGICNQIGGDDQRVTNMQPHYRDLSYKYILLPIWLGVFRYHKKSYQILVNARTGEVQGERPYSWPKITLAVILAASLAYGVWRFFSVF